METNANAAFADCEIVQPESSESVVTGKRGARENIKRKYVLTHA